jgi:sensor histidine kinase YesM
MAALQSQALIEQNPHQIALYLSKYSKIMRLTLEDSYNNLVSIESELDFVQQYLDLQKLRLKDKFTYHITISDEVETSMLLIPSMILQPFIENSIEHGFSNIQYPGLIEISIGITGKILQIEMNDNGMGNASERHIKEFPSRSTSIIQDRLFLFGKQVKQQARFEMFKKENEKGFRVNLYLPIITHG